MTLNPLDQILNEPEVRDLDLEWGYVTSVAPLRIRHELSPDPIPITPSRLVNVSVGDRIYYVHQGRKIVILGIAAPPSDGGGGGQPWSNWVPTLLAANVNPVMGNSERIGRYRVSADGSVDFTGKITFGSTFNANGSGAWSMTLPVPPNVSGGLEWKASLYVVSSAVLSGGGEGEGYGKIEDGTVTRMFVRRNDPTASNPQRLEGSAGFVRGNKIVVTGTYEEAT